MNPDLNTYNIFTMEYAALLTSSMTSIAQSFNLHISFLARSRILPGVPIANVQVDISALYHLSNLYLQ